MADIADDAGGGVGEEGVVEEGEDEAADAQVDEVEAGGASVGASAFHRPKDRGGKDVR